MQWYIRTHNSIKCQKLHTGLGRLILTCYNDRLYSDIAKLVSRPVWEQGQAGLTPVTQISKTVCSIAEQTVFAIFSIFLSLFLFAVQILSSLFIVTFFFDVKTRETVVYYPQVNEQAEAFASACFSKIVDSFPC